MLDEGKTDREELTAITHRQRPGELKILTPDL